ncbi:hypothetical protein [Amycolatopsis sp. NPDC004378]
MTETPARRWPKTGTVGAHISKDVGDHCTTGDPAPEIPARPYPGETRPFATGGLIRLPGDHGDAVPAPISRCLYEQPLPTPPPAAELLAMADDLNAHGGLDETFVAELIRQAVTDEPLDAAYKALGVPRPAPGSVPPVTTTAAETISYETIVEALEKVAPLRPPPEPIKLTREQWAAVPKASPGEPWELYPGLVGTRVELVETVQESTPYRLWLEQAEAESGLKAVVELPSGAILGDPAWLVEADREFVAHVNDGVDRGAVLDAVRAAADEAVANTAPYGPKLEFGAARRPRAHQHIWTTTSPTRCVACRRYLRPWWRRALDRARRWWR